VSATHVPATQRGRHVPAIRRGRLSSCNYVQHPRPHFKGNISVADYMPLSSLLKTIKINGGVECSCVWKSRHSQRISGRSLLDCHVWSPLTRSIIGYTTRGNDRLRYKQDPLMRSTVCTHQWISFVTQSDEYTPKTFKSTVLPPPHLETLKNIATKSGETHVLDR